MLFIHEALSGARPLRALFTAALALTLAACGDDGATDGADAGTSVVDAQTADVPQIDASTGLPAQLGAPERPARLVVPDAYDGTTPLPVVFLLHGFGASGIAQDAYFRLSATARERGLYTITPDGTMGSDGRRFWNATDACCDFEMTGVDDVAYLMSLLDELESIAPVDTARVYFVGHSNGGYMSHRVACDRAPRVTAIASLAGAEWGDPERCAPEAPVSVLQIHGTDDETVAYEGSAFGGRMFPGAEEIVARWAARDSCAEGDPETLEPRDLETRLDGAETIVRRYSEGCAEGVDVELWRMEGGSHLPALSPTFSADVLDWLLRHSR